MTSQRDPDGTVRHYLTVDPPILHRLDGPAVLRPDGTEEWWIHGFQIPTETVKPLADRLLHWHSRHPPKINWGAAGPAITWGGDRELKPELSPPQTLYALAERTDLDPWLRTLLKEVADQLSALATAVP